MSKDWHKELIFNVEETGRYITENAANLVGDKSFICDFKIVATFDVSCFPTVNVERAHPVIKVVIE